MVCAGCKRGVAPAEIRAGSGWMEIPGDHRFPSKRPITEVEYPVPLWLEEQLGLGTVTRFEKVPKCFFCTGCWKELQVVQPVNRGSPEDVWRAREQIGFQLAAMACGDIHAYFKKRRVADADPDEDPPQSVSAPGGTGDTVVVLEEMAIEWCKL